MERPILFFDGVCGLCNWSVDFILKRDQKKQLYYSPLQGEQVKKLSLQLNTDNLDTLYLWTGDELLEKSAAWLWIMRYLGGFWFVITWPFRLIPYFILDFFYDFIAKHRYSIFGKRESCRLPSADESKYFLN